jgi:hypothetical protein
MPEPFIWEIERHFSQKWDSMDPDFREFMAVLSSNEISGNVYIKAASRINHSCIPNMHYEINPNTEIGTFHAIRDIHPQEELTRSYLPEHSSDLISRRGLLVQAYGFTCTCEACMDTGDTLRLGGKGDRIFLKGVKFMHEQERERPVALGDWKQCKKIVCEMTNVLRHVPSSRCMDA